LKALSKSIFLAISVVPLVAGLVYCLLYALGLVGLTAKGFTLDHFKTVFEEGYFVKALLYSVYQALTGTLLALSLAFVLFYLVKNGSKSTTQSRWPVLYVPLLMPPMVVSFVFFAFWSNSGLFSRLLHSLGWLSEPSAFANVVNGKAGMAIILAHLFLAVPFFTINLFNIYRGQNIGQLKQLALSLGASQVQVIKRVEMPVLLRFMRRVAVLYFIFMFGAYEIPLLLGAESTRMLSLVVLDKLTRFDVMAKPQAYAMASMYLVLATCLVFFLFSAHKKSKHA